MTRRFFSGNSLDQAVLAAARHYGIEPAELAYRQIEKRHGFLRTRKSVLIAVDPEEPRRDPAAKSADAVAPPAAAEPAGRQEDPPGSEEPVAEGRGVEVAPLERPAVEFPGLAEPASEEPVEEQSAEDEAAEDGWYAAEEAHDRPEAEAAEPADERDDQPTAEPAVPASTARGEHDEELLAAAERSARLLMRFAGIEADARARSGEERVDVEVEGPDSSVLVVESGKGLLAIQHLLPRMMRGMTGRSSFVRVDSRGFHRKRKERLEALAVKEAEAVSRNGTPRTLPPMAPDERRIVHLAVQEIPTVVTESRGSGLHKRVVIRPAAADGGHDDIEARHGF